jgi:CRISPR-associated endonuclease/helicase Cas3
MINVGCVARCIAEMTPVLLKRYNLHASTIGALAALHDLGKISPGFQRKCEKWLEENGLADFDKRWNWLKVKEKDHGLTSQAEIQRCLSDHGIPNNVSMYLGAALGGHHGRIKKLPQENFRRYDLDASISDSQSGTEWNKERQNAVHDVVDYFQCDLANLDIDDNSPALWWLAGLTSVADWIGSDERFFSPVGGGNRENIASDARNALDTIGFRKMGYFPNLSFHDLFHDEEKPTQLWIPNEMQEKAYATISKPGVYVIEAPMGMGKTEAALWAAYRLLIAGEASGIYFALTTQATSNRMHLRMEEFVERITASSQSSRLIHGNSWLRDEKSVLSPVATSNAADKDDARSGRDWFSSAKRALIAPFGVGTVDQALLGVVAAKHFFVRHFALAGKVVILDEVHSYDVYTGTLIDKLITTLEGLGCTVIVLSATLFGKRREQIISSHDNESVESERPYPLITGRTSGILIEPVAAQPPKPRTIVVEFKAAEGAMTEAISVARNGGAVLWICNTVGAAQAQHASFCELVQDAFPLGLLHSRFPFWRREEIETEWMERFGKNSDNRCGSILVSTQIVEQSVDLDADLMITELAPTDMLLQRLGRLWRHERENRPVSDNAKLCIIEEKRTLDEFRILSQLEIKKELGSKAHVYDPFILLRTLEVWQNLNEITIPEQIRSLIENTYTIRIDEPEAWQGLDSEMSGKKRAFCQKALMSSNIWQVLLNDEEGVQTRLNEVETVSVVLCLEIDNQKARFVDKSIAELGGEDFRLATAQAIHRNLVKVPEYHFHKGAVEPCPAFSEYLHGNQTFGIITENGEVEVKGLKNGIRLIYSEGRGLVIEKSS